MWSRARRGRAARLESARSRRARGRLVARGHRPRRGPRAAKRARARSEPVPPRGSLVVARRATLAVARGAGGRVGVRTGDMCGIQYERRDETLCGERHETRESSGLWRESAPPRRPPLLTKASRLKGRTHSSRLDLRSASRQCLCLCSEARLTTMIDVLSDQRLGNLRHATATPTDGSATAAATDGGTYSFSR